MSNNRRDGNPAIVDKIIKSIGKGSYGDVLLVKRYDDILARKEVKCNDKSTQIVINRRLHEIDTLKELNNENILKLSSYYIDMDNTDRIYIYTEYYEKGDLWKRISHKKKRVEDFSIGVLFYNYVCIFYRKLFIL